MADSNQPTMTGKSSEATDPVVSTIRDYREAARMARERRMSLNARNRDALMGRQDWSHKQAGQSTEFLPKLANAAEQMGAFIKRGLTQFGHWYSVELDRTLEKMIDGSQIRTILNCYLDNLWQANHSTTTLPLIMSDVVKLALTESLMIVKVHGGMMPKRTFKFDRKSGKMEAEEAEEWRLRIDIIRPEDYYPDPSGAGLYEIHSCEKDLHEVLAMSDKYGGPYKEAEVQKLIGQAEEKPDDEKRDAVHVGQNEPITPGSRKPVVIDEFWGTLLNPDGTIAHRNVVATVANGRFLIRPPEPNPFWHQESPFVAAPLVRVPFSVWHKALYDSATDLNLAINELFNLIVDGGLAEVWGVKQLRLEDLEDPSQVTNGIPQGSTLAVKQTLPPGQKVMETVTTGAVPRDAMAVFEFLNREFNAAVLTNETKLGAIPAKQVRATEIVEASQSQAITLDGIVTDIEHAFGAKLLRLAWLTVLQEAEYIPDQALAGLVDRQVAELVIKSSPEERFSLFFGKTNFKMHGLSGTMAKAMEFQKIMALLQTIMQNPLLLQAFLKRFSAEKTLRKMMRTLNLNIDEITKSSDEEAETGQELQGMANISALMGLGGTPNASAPGSEGTGGGPPGVGGGELAAQINQNAYSRNGLTPNA